MWPIVQQSFSDFTAQYEGVVPEMYVDVKGLVTFGIGNLGDPLVLAYGANWTRRSDGQSASKTDVATEWAAVKTGKLAWYKGRPPRPLYLTPAEITRIVTAKLLVNEGYLARRWPNWAVLPADFQLGAHSCAWAAGAGWRAPAFDAAVATLDFHAIAGPPGDAQNDATCRGQGWLNDTGNAGLRPRNLANKVLFQNAAVVVSDGYDPFQLYWPKALDG